MKRYLLFAWPAGNFDVAVFAGWNCFRGKFDTEDDAMLSFYRDYPLFERGQIVDIDTMEVANLNQLLSTDCVACLFELDNRKKSRDPHTCGK